LNGAERSGQEVVSGFGFTRSARAVVQKISSLTDLLEAVSHAKINGTSLCLRGAGRSYGDAAISEDATVLDFRPMNRILGWNSAEGLLDVEPGVTLEQIWKLVLPEGYWPPVVSGTMFTTSGGAFAMNIHGKNHFRAGSFAEHVTEIDWLDANGAVQTASGDMDAFQWLAGSSGLLAPVTRIQIQCEKVPSGDLLVTPQICKDWDAQFRFFDEHVGNSDYLVSWIDGFAGGRNAGRGIAHRAIHVEGLQETLSLKHQILPNKIAGIIPKRMVWRFLRLLTHRPGIRALNSLRMRGSHRASRAYTQSLAAFSFLLDYVPGWEKSYAPHGFVQIQPFVPRESAHWVLPRVMEIAQALRRESFLVVLKRHRRDAFPLAYACDGYSLAMDFPRLSPQDDGLVELSRRITDVVIEAGGAFYLAKDSLLQPKDIRNSWGNKLLEFQGAKRQFDPSGLFTSNLAKRLDLFPGA